MKVGWEELRRMLDSSSLCSQLAEFLDVVTC
jgi:hypothetical protein